MTRNLIILGCAVLLAITMSSVGVFAGSLPDGDGDGVPDDFDNCLGAPNGPLNDPSGCGQTDGALDGYGNFCDSDVSNNNAVDLPDVSLVLGGLGGTASNLDVTCNGAVDLPDISKVLGDLGGQPGPSGLGCAGTTPCP